jgi:hypothetical protein
MFVASFKLCLAVANDFSKFSECKYLTASFAVFFISSLEGFFDCAEELLLKGLSKYNNKKNILICSITYNSHFKYTLKYDLKR